MFKATCNNNVDFPIPGSPPKSVTEPFTKPPPKTVSNSLLLVTTLSSGFS